MNEEIYPLRDGGRAGSQLRTTNWIAGAFLSMLRQYFGSTERISLEKGRLLWDPDAQVSEVQIDVVDNLRYDEANKHPKILVDIEDQEFTPETLGDVDHYIPESGTVQYLNTSSSFVSVHCWGFQKLEAQSIADEVRYFLQTYRHPLAQHYQLSKLRVTRQIKPVRYNSYKDYWIARVMVQIQNQEGWGVSHEQLKVSAISLGLALQTEP